MSSGIFGSIPTGSLGGAQADPFAGTMGGATQMGATQRGGSTSDPFAGQMGGATPINMWASPFATTPSQVHAQPFHSGNVQQPMGGQGGGGGASSGGGQSSQGASPLGMAGKVMGAMGGMGGMGSQGANGGWQFNGAKGPQGMNGQGQGGSFSQGMNGGQFGGLAGKIQNWMGQGQGQGGNMGDPAQGMTNQMSPGAQGMMGNQPQAAPQAAPQTSNGNMLNNLSQLPTGGLDGGLGSIGSFLGGPF